jgi:hypothetical protein
MKLRILLASLMVLALIPALTAPVMEAQQPWNTSTSGAPTPQPPPARPPAPAAQPAAAADCVTAQPTPGVSPAEVVATDTPAEQTSDQDEVYRQWQEGLISDKEYDQLAPKGSCGLQAGWPGPDGYGYNGQTAAYNWVEISASGKAVYLGDDSYDGPFPIGFPFKFYGSVFTEFYLSSNGYMTFGSGSITDFNACPLPGGAPPDNLIAMMWDDLDPGDTNDLVYYQTFSPCPIGPKSACLIVQYDDFCHYPGGPTCDIAGTWEAILFAGSGHVILQYQDAGAEEGAGSTTGIEGANSHLDYGLTYTCNTGSSISDGLAIAFLFPTGVVLTPPAAAKAACEYSDATYTLTLGNHTGANATFALEYDSDWPISGPANLYVVNEAIATFDVIVSVPCGSVSDVATVTASGNGYSGSSTLTTSSTTGGLQSWESITPINGLGRARPAAAAVAGKVYVIGGEISGGRADTVEEYDPATGLWTTQAGLMPVPASNLCAAAIGTDIYFPGGHDASSSHLTTLQVYHTTTDTWDTVATDPLPAPRSGLACAALGGKLYAFGGTDGAYQNTAYVYNPAAAAGSRWTTLPNMTYTRAYLAGVAVNGKVYAVGGRDSATTDFAYVEAYNPADGAWHTVTPMSTARGGPGAMVSGNQLVACGGGWGTYLNSCETYDTTAGYGGSWTNLPETMITGRRTYAYASLPEALYAVAGYNGTFLTAAERLPILVCEPCPPPEAEVTPGAFEAELCSGSASTQTLMVCNGGEADLTWSLSEHLPPGGTHVLWDNGPLVTHPGGGFGGGDASAVQMALGMITYGAGHQFSLGNRVADDFVVTDAAGWEIEQITFFAHQTGAPASPSPITGVYYQIWDGPPGDTSSHVLFGDLASNRLVSSTFSGIYRVTDTNLLSADRKVFANTADAGVFLPQGTYWLDWTTDGSLSSGPWAPPVTILGQTTTGNGKQWLGSAWSALLDDGTLTPQGLPFVLEGQIGATSGRVAIFKDADPWASITTEAFLGANGIPYDVHTSAEFGSLNFGNYAMIVFSGDQPQSFYDAYAGFVSKFENYVAGGGFLNFFACDRGPHTGTLGAPLPGGMSWASGVFEWRNVISEPAHPVVQGVPNPFYGSYASHGHFGSLPAGAHTIAREQSGLKPTIVEYPIGAGWLIAFGQPLELSAELGWDAGQIFRNALLWGHGTGQVPWLGESPLAGTLTGGQCQAVAVTFEATDLSPGTYTGSLRLASNDGDEAWINLPVRLVCKSCVYLPLVVRAGVP